MGEPRVASGQLGSLVLGRYRIVRQLATGGMGVVYLARAEGAGGFIKPVVVKQVLPSFDADDTATGLFVREARILAHLRHPGIVNVLDFGEADNGYVMIMEYVHGYNLAQWTRYLRRAQRSVPVELMLSVAVQVLEALEYVHNQVGPNGQPLQITHRDVSPSNILLDTHGRVRLLDFGVARIDGASTGYKTAGAGFRGKLPFTAPEVFEGAPPGPQTDVYAAAVMVHATLMGSNCFAAQTEAQTVARVGKLVPPPLSEGRSDIPEGLDAVLARALAKDPRARFASAAQLAEALGALLPKGSSKGLTEALGEMLTGDFGQEMADCLGVDSLAALDHAWRHLEEPPESARPRSTATTARPRSGQGAGALDHEGTPSVSEGVLVSLADASADRTLPPPGQSTLPPSPTVAWREARTPHTTVRQVSAQRGKPWLWALLATAVAGLGVAVYADWRQANSQRIVMVQSSAFEARQAPAAAPNAQPIGEPNTANAVNTPKPPNDTAPALWGVTSAFHARQDEVAACFESHPLPAQGQLVIRFDLRRDGSVHRASIKPVEYHGSTLGGCLRAVALQTRFPAQPAPISLQIPVSAQRVPLE